VPRPIPTSNGILSWDLIRSHVRRLGPHQAPTGLIEVENTHNMAGGTVYPLDVLDEIQAGARSAGLPVHMDGARVFNAAASLGVPVSELAAKADTVMFCLSKGLGAPVGSILAGTRSAIDKGRLYRKRLGGGMRQAGVIAAAGLIALEEMPKRLHEDHANAKRIASELASLPGLSIDPASVQTNIVILDVTASGMNSQTISQKLRERGVLANGVGPSLLRLVTHMDVSEAMCLEAVGALREIVSGSRIHAKISSC
jgi:threonine aldolase